jgi:FkbM family methyltransferase
MITAPGRDDYLGQGLEIGLIRAVAAHVRARFFVDVGAERGSFAAVLFELGMRGALFEPMPRHREALAALAGAHASSAHAIAIDERDGVRDLHVASDRDGKELDFFHSLQKVDADARFRHSRTLRVECRSIESLAREGVIPAQVGILKTDTEGHDLFVLKGLGGLRPELVICEYFTEDLYAGWDAARPQLAIELMRSIGYRRYVATKRIGELEYCTASPGGFLPRQWGNLFFLSDGLFADAEGAIARFLEQVESRFIAGLESIIADRAAKEAVIQELLRR